MRQIKFKIWCEKEKKMYPPIVLQEYMSMSESAQDDIQPAGEKNRLLLEWTGLLDKNGVEIYEGDVVIQVGVKKDGKTRLVRKPRVVEWVYTKSNAGFNLAPSPESYADRTMLRTEIIGNIYENPDLIK